MKYENSSEEVVLLKRYKRFLADVEFPDGRIETVHCPNPGSMKSCVGQGWKARVTKSLNLKRKLPYTLEQVKGPKCWIGVNPNRANDIAEETLREGLIANLSFDELKREVKVSESRLDFLLTKEKQKIWVEVKSVSMLLDGQYQFPDSVTTRGHKHLKELMTLVKKNQRAAMLFIVQRSDAKEFAPADSIDPEYGKLLREAYQRGVEIYAVQCRLSKNEICGSKILSVRIE